MVTWHPRGSVVVPEYIDATKDAEALQKAMKGLGTKEKVLIDILAHRTNEQRLEIAAEYRNMYNRELIKDLTSETSGDFQGVLQGLAMNRVEYEATEAKNALKSKGHDALIELLVTKNNERIQKMSKVYTMKFSRDLEKDIVQETSGQLQALLLALLEANRNEDYEFDEELAYQDATALSSEAKIGGTTSQLIDILTTRSKTHIYAVMDEYKRITGKNIEEVVQKDMTGESRNGVLALIQSLCYLPRFFALSLRSAMKGLGTNEKKLTRIVVTRCEEDMEQIKEEFLSLSGKSLHSWVKGDTSGDYKGILVALMGEEIKA